MEKLLVNQMDVNKNKNLKRIQKSSFQRYGLEKRSVRARIGKLVELTEEVRSSDPREKFVTVEKSVDEIWNILSMSGMNGMSGNGFSVYKKMMTVKEAKDSKILIVNGMECEPGLLHDEWLLKNRYDEIIKGMEIIQRLIHFDRSILAEKESIFARSPVKHCMVDGYYPMGEEHLLIGRILDKQLKKNEIPAEHGILVMNVQTVYQIYKLVQDQYKEGRYVTLANLETGKANVEFVLNGEPIWEKMQELFPEVDIHNCFAGGGILSADVVGREECFHDKISFAAIGRAEIARKESKCKGCGNCERNCPMGIPIKKIIKQEEKNRRIRNRKVDSEKSQEYVEQGSGYRDICLQCGSCTYFCKAGKNIPQYVRGVH